MLDASGRGELGLSVELAGGPERVLTIAASDAGEHGVRFHAGGGAELALPALRETVALIEAGRLTFPVARTFSLAQAAEALEESRSGHPDGKLVILP